LSVVVTRTILLAFFLARHSPVGSHFCSTFPFLRVPGPPKVSPEERDRTLRSFAAGACRVLVCTDLAARGLDISGVGHVVQFEFATNVVGHLHRLGRTARAGSSGRATHFFEPGADLPGLVRAATEAGVPLEEAFSRKRGLRKKIKKAGRAFNSKANQRGEPAGGAD